MELGLSLGETSKAFGGIMENTIRESFNKTGLSLSIGTPVGAAAVKQAEEDNPRKLISHSHEGENMVDRGDCESLSPKPNQLPLQLDLLPHTPVVLPRTSILPLSFTWPPSTENGDNQEEGEEGPAVSSSPNNSAASSFQMDLCIYSKGLNQYGKRESDGEGCDQRASSRASDEDDNSGTRKKLRLSKEQSAFLEDNFKEHSTLNPKQKLALAKQLGLRPRQVEVWFQNRRARTKLKQTEVDCEYLKKCCETLTEENRRLQKELQELRALKSSHPFYMQLPATTLTMCPSCERVATNSTSAASSNTPPSTANTNGASSTTNGTNKTSDPIFNTNIGFPISRPKFYPFAHT